MTNTNSENIVKVGIGVMVIKDNKVLLGKRKGSHGEGEYAWPGGHLEYMESFEGCARREVLEETGMTIKNICFLRLKNFREYAPKHYVDIQVTAEWESGEPKVLESDRVHDWNWYDLNNLPSPLFAALPTALEAYKTGRNGIVNMEKHNEIKQLISSVLDRGYLTTLAIMDEGGVWACDVIYIYDDDLNIYWMSDPDARHSQAIMKRNQIAGTITVSGQGENNLGIQFSGTAERIEGARYDLTKKHFLKRRKPIPHEDVDVLEGDSWYILKPQLVELIHEELYEFDKQKWVAEE